MEKQPDPFSLYEQLVRVLRPSKLEDARNRERQKERDRYKKVKKKGDNDEDRSNDPSIRE